MNRKTMLWVVAVVAVLVIGFVGWRLTGKDAGEPPSRADMLETPAPTDSPKASEPTPEPTPLEIGSAFTKTQEIGNGAEVKIAGIEAVHSQAQIKGEISGPAIRVTVEVSAGSDKIDLSRVLVNAYYGKAKTPAIEVGAPGGSPFSGTLEAKKQATGVYIFNVPADERGDVQIEVVHPNSTKPVKYRGSVA